VSANPVDDNRNEQPVTPVPSASVRSLREARRAFEREYILTVLAQQDWSIAGTARALGLQRPNLYRKARQLAIPLKRMEGVQ
jgi:transcriptional regulator with GAF, ATPase, and Fis domain